MSAHHLLLTMRHRDIMRTRVVIIDPAETAEAAWTRMRRRGIRHLDQACRIKVVLSGLPSVVIEHTAASVKPAVTGAITSVERPVRRTVERPRTTDRSKR